MKISNAVFYRLFFFLLSVMIFVNSCQAATNETKNALTLEISAPQALAGLQANYQPNPVYLQFSNTNGLNPVYSAAVYPGVNKSVVLKITSADSNGAQIQFISNTTGTTQPLSFIYAFSGERLACLINKNAKIRVFYNVNNKLLDVLDIPADC